MLSPEELLRFVTYEPVSAGGRLRVLGLGSDHAQRVGSVMEIISVKHARKTSLK